MIFIDNVIGFDALYDSMLKTRKGVMWKDSVMAYNLNAVERTMNLERDLKNGTYKAKPPIHFVITSPKRREIASITYRDRVYQRSLNDNAIYPIMVKSFIRDNCACQKGKGTDDARERLKVHLQRFYRKHGAWGYVAQFDIHGYYPNMSHEYAESVFKRQLDTETFERTCTILREQYEGDKGYNPGSQLIQIAGISVLNELDHYIKERLRCRYYIRYMDDFLILHHDENELKALFTEVQKRLESIGFELNPKKSKVYSMAYGIDFLGFNWRVTETGKIIRYVRTENIKRERRKLRRLADKSKRGLIPREKVDESYRAWRNHAEKGNSYNLLKRMDMYYRDLWGTQE